MSKVKRYILDPGDYYCSNGNVVISTLLGSCVSACLFDPVNRIVAMNHFLLTSRNKPLKDPLYHTESGRYGIHSMELIVNGMMKLGAQRKHIKAKAFGGGNVLQTTGHNNDFFRIGDVNTKFIKDFLENEKIPLVASDLGGEFGRVIKFFSQDFRVMVKKIGQAESRKIASDDQLLLDRVNKEQEQYSTNVQLWRGNLL